MSFRSLHIVKTILAEFNLPTRTGADTRVLIEEHQVAEDYERGDLVYSAKYNEYAEIVKDQSCTKEEGTVYQIYILGAHCQYAYQPYYELIDLRKAQNDLDINISAQAGIGARPLPKAFA